jgi:hypothetical protein
MKRSCKPSSRRCARAAHALKPKDEEEPNFEQDCSTRLRHRRGELPLRSQGSVPWSPAPASPRREITLPAGSDRVDPRPIRAESRARLLEGIAKARLWLAELVTGHMRDTGEIARREGYSERSVRMTLSLAFLSPTIMQAAVDGTLGQGHGVSSLLELPVDWQKQMEILAPPR